MKREKIYRVHAGNSEPHKCNYYGTKQAAIGCAKRRVPFSKTDVFVEKREVVDGQETWHTVHVQKFV
jgi:hypothetical protein